MINFKNKLLEQIKEEAGSFNYNKLYQLSWDLKCDFVILENYLKELLDEKIIVKLYYNPFEKRSANMPIGEDSFEVFLIKNKKINLKDLFE